MLSYFFKRVLFFLPVLLIVSVFIFLISKLAPGDPINNLLESNLKSSEPLALEKILKEKQKEYGLDLPLFYFSIRRKSEPSIVSEIVSPSLKSHLKSISYQCGNPQSIVIYYEYLINLSSQSINRYETLLETNNIKRLKALIEDEKVMDGLEKTKTWNNYLLTFTWNSDKNQYHQWISNILRGELGKSYRNNKRVDEEIKKALRWTLSLSILSLIISFFIAIPSAVYSVIYPKSFFSKVLDNLFFAFYATPTFVVASLLLLFFSSGEFIKWFPSYGIGYVEENADFLDVISTRVKHLFLPLFCWTYGSIAYLYRQLRSSLSEEIKKDYIQTAKSKGLSSNNIYWKQALRNSLIPIITILGSYFPVVIGGSFVIEHIFSIPGMASLTLDAFYARDYPLLFSISLLASFATISGAFVADVLYHFADPRWQLKTNDS